MPMRNISRWFDFTGVQGSRVNDTIGFVNEIWGLMRSIREKNKPKHFAAVCLLLSKRSFMNPMEIVTSSN